MNLHQNIMILYDVVMMMIVIYIYISHLARENHDDHLDDDDDDDDGDDEYCDMEYGIVMGAQIMKLHQDIMI